MHRSVVAGLLASICALALGCGDSGKDKTKGGVEIDSIDPKDPDDPNFEHEDEEVLANASGRVDEAQIRAAVVGDDLEVLLPVEREGRGVLAGVAAVTLRNASDQRALGDDDEPFDQDDDRGEYRLLIAGAGKDLQRAAAAGLLLDWKVDLPAGELHGRRSLYTALGRMAVQVRGASSLPASGSAPLRVLVHDVATGAAIADAAVTASLLPADANSDARELFAGETDTHGEHLAALELPQGVDKGRVRVDVRSADAQVWTYLDVTRASDPQGVYLSSDKTIYQPGQTIALRALALNAQSRKPVVDSEAVFEARDGKGNKVFRKRAQTDEYGVAATQVPTDPRVNEGTWTFSVAVAGGKQELKLPVNRYNLPKMNVAVSAEAAFALPGDTIVGAVDAFYVFGEPVTSAQVEIQVRAGNQALPPITGTTDSAGHLAFSLALPSTLTVPAMDSTGSSLSFSATVTDGAMQREAGTAVIPLTRGPMLIDAISEFGELLRGVDNRVFVIVTDPAGRPLAADVEVELDGQPLADARTGSDGIATLAVRALAQGSHALKVTATDDAARSHSRTISFGGDGRNEHLALRATRALFGPGDSVELEVLSDAGATRAFVDVYQGARGVHSQSVELAEGAGGLRFTVSQEMRGIVFVDAFAFSASGTPLRASRRLLIEGGDRLQVELTSDAESYAPGQEARVTVSVKDALGDPQVASLGLTVVNEASFQLGGEPASDLVRHFSYDASTLPADLSVLDLGVESLFAGTRDARARAAELLLSRAGKAEVPVFFYDALPSERPQVTSTVSQLVALETQQFFAALSTLVGSSGAKTEPLNRAALALAETRLDPFGQAYRLMQNASALAIVFTSAGPDEVFGNADDVTQQVAYGQLETSRINASRTMMLGGAAGASAAAGAGGAGALPGAQAPNAGFPQQTPPVTMAGDLNGMTQDPASEAGSGAPRGPTVRKDFRETVYNNPVLITDANGQASVSFPLAHAITSWRVSADGSTRDGKLGRARHGFRTFQSFFVDFDVPTHLTRGDVIKLPAVVYNYLAEPATVAVSLQAAPFFQVVGAASQQLSLGPSEVRAVTFEVRIIAAGEQQFTLVGTAGGKQDAIARSARIDPDGQPEDLSFSGKIGATKQSYSIDLPIDTVQGGGSLVLSLTPGFAAEAVSGLASMVQEPNGCFEQTTSTAWPNTLIHNYLRETGADDVEQLAQIEQTVTRGYQRLLTFESPTGGFNWWGDSDPGNRILSAIMLWHLKDLEGVVSIDEAVRDRTLVWLVGQQQGDGSWPTGDMLHGDNAVVGSSATRTTAFIAWALAHTGWADESVKRAVVYLEANQPPMTDLYANALSANALAVAAPKAASTAALFDRIEQLKELDAEGRASWPTETPSWTGASGGAAAIETTGLVAYGMVKAGVHAGTAASALSYLIANKDSVGSWHNTQATMNALRALGAAAGGTGNDAEGALQVRINGNLVQTVDVAADTNDLHREIDLSAYLASGNNSVELTYAGSKEVSYQLTRRAYRPVLPAAVGPLDLQVAFDDTDVNVGDTVSADVTVTNNDTETRNQVLVKLGIAPGMVPNLEDLAKLVREHRISRFELRDQDVVMYCMGLVAGEARKLPVRMTATLAATATAPASSVYAYYEPLLKRLRPAVRFTVR